MSIDNYRHKLTPYLFLAPAAVLLILFFFYPFFQTLLLSFQSFDTNLYSPVFCGVENYSKIFHSQSFFKVLINTFLYMLIAVPILVIFPIIIAIAINQKIRGISIYRVILYIPAVVSIVVAAIAFKWLYANDGLLNYFFGILGIDKIGWLTDPNVALFSVIALTIWKGLGYYAIIYLATLLTIPDSLYEAADIDGANTFQKHIKITIPYLWPAITLVATMSSISALKVFTEVYVMTKGGPMDSTSTIVYYVYKEAFENLNLGLASAGGVILLIIAMIISVLNIKCFEKGGPDVQ